MSADITMRDKNLKHSRFQNTMNDLLDNSLVLLGPDARMDVFQQVHFTDY